jgi:hypothetical protein
MNLFDLSKSSTSKLRHFRYLLVAGVLAAGPCAYGAGAADPAGGDSVIARVGDTEVKLEEIRGAIEGLDARKQAALERDPSLLNQTVRTLLMRRVVLKEALAPIRENPSE